jgi:hypothetical protein
MSRASRLTNRGEYADSLSDTNTKDADSLSDTNTKDADSLSDTNTKDADVVDLFQVAFPRNKRFFDL